MTNEKLVLSIVPADNLTTYNCALEVAKRKDVQYKILLDAKDQSIIQTELDKNEEIQNLKDEILSKLVDLSIWKNNRPISKLGGWHTEPPTEDGLYLADKGDADEDAFRYIVVQWSCIHKLFSLPSEVFYQDIKRWKRI